MILWRACLLLFGLVWLAIAAHDAYRVVAEPGLLSWTLGVLHGLFFLILGTVATGIALLARGPIVRDMAIEIVRGVFSRQNLGEFAVWMGAAVLIALIATALIGWMR